MFLVGVGFLMELLVLGLIVGFIAGYFCNNWFFTKKLANKLDELLGNKCKKE